MPKKNHLLILFLIGMLLFVAVIPLPSSDQADTSAESESVSTAGVTGTSMGEYETYLEDKTADLLKQVDGVGEVTVMLTLKSGGQKIIEKDSPAYPRQQKKQTVRAERVRLKIRHRIRRVFMNRRPTDLLYRM